MKKRNRLLAILLTAIMTFSMLPSEAFATEAIDTGETAAAAVEETVSSVGEEQDVEATVEEVSTVEEAAEEIADPAEAEEVVTEETVTEEAVTEEAAEPAADQEDEDASEEAADPAEAEEIAEPAVEAVVETAETVEWPITLEAKGSDYTVTATFDESAGFPADVKMNVSEINKGSDAYQNYYDQALEAVQNETDKEVKLTDARFFDITFSTEAGEVEPTGPVNVIIKYRKAIEAESKDDVHVLHFDDNDNAAPQVMDIETDGRGDKVDEVSFATEGFSVYAVIGTGEGGDNARATVNFLEADGDLIKTMYVKNKEDDLETAVYDPGAGTVADGYSFYGWSVDDLKDSEGDYYRDTDEYVGQAYTTKTTPMKIDEVRTYIAGLDIKEGDVLNIYAMTFTHYTVEYVGPNDVSVGSASVLVKEADVLAPYKVNMGYATDDVHNFEGWIAVEGSENIDGYPDNAETTTIDGRTIRYYKNGTELEIKGNVKFSANAPEGHWLIFDENGKGATYIAPDFIKSDEVTSGPDPLDMIRNGYTFKGWYYFPDGDAPAAVNDETDLTNAEPFEFGSPLDARTIVYAKWEAITDANYTVIIWKQNVAGNGYDFVESVRPSGTVGTIPDVVDETNGHVTGAEYTGEAGFSYKSTDQASKTIAPEGNTVVNVYWDRIEYTLRFYSNNPNNEYKNISGYELVRIRSGYSYDYAIKIDETWHRIDYRGDRIWSSTSGISVNTSNGHISYDYYGSTRTDGTYLADTYTIPEDSRLIKTITALYGADIRSNFPIVGSNGTTYTGASWSPSGSTAFDNNAYISYIDTMQAESTTFILADNPTSNYYTYHVKYYVEALPGDTDTVTFNSKTFTLYYDAEIHSSYSNLYSTESEEFTEITGYTKYGSNPVYSNGRANFDSNRTISLYYTRKAYSILFYDGAYFDGNNNPIEEPKQGEFKHDDNILYGASIESYNEKGDTYYVPSAPIGYAFEGWCIDDACTHPYTFTTMPEGGLTVYAKWRQIQYRVFLHPNAGHDANHDPSLTWGSDDQEMNFRINYNGQISLPDGVRSGYDFLGWYIEVNGESMLYPESLHLRDDSASSADYFKPYDKTADFTDPMDKWGDGAKTNADINRFWITKKLDLNAKWSKRTIGADGIYIVYDAGKAGAGTVVPTDSLVHKDNTDAVAGAAAIPPADSKKVFKQWGVQTWNGTDYVPTDKKVLPGGTFTVNVEDAKITEGETVVPLENVEEGHEYTYTILLVAEYEDAEEATPTHITWYANNGTGDTEISKDLKVNEAVDIMLPGGKFSYANHDFLGWAKLVEKSDEAGNVTSIGGASPDNLELELDENNLFLKWDAENERFIATATTGSDYSEGQEVKQIAADEKLDYHGMVAVWNCREFHIYHSATGEIEDVKVPKGPIDLTKYVTSGYLYGGYYHYDKVDEQSEERARGEVYTVDGTQFEPTADVYYYLKEVNPNHVIPKTYLVKNTTHNNLIQGLYAIMDIDEYEYTYGEDVEDYAYDNIGMVVNGETEGYEVDELAIEGVTFNGKKTTTVTSSNLSGISGAVVGLQDLTDLVFGDAEITIRGYFTTRDGVTVYGKKERWISFPAGDERYGGMPLFTGWGNVEDGKTATGLNDFTSEPTGESASNGRRLTVVRMLTVAAPSDKIEYKILKIYDSGTEEQMVEGGNNTGKIDYTPKSGYMFAGWYQDAAYTIPADFANVAGDMTVYAKYISNKDVKLAFKRIGTKNGVSTFNVTVTVNNHDQLENVGVNIVDGNTAVLPDKTMKQSGTGKRVKYTTEYKGSVDVIGLSLVDTFTSFVSWTTPDGTTVEGANKKCTYQLGKVTVR